MNEKENENENENWEIKIFEIEVEMDGPFPEKKVQEGKVEEIEVKMEMVMMGVIGVELRVAKMEIGEVAKGFSKGMKRENKEQTKREVHLLHL